MVMRKLVFAQAAGGIAGIVLMTNQGLASAGFDCVIEDGNISFAASGWGPRGIPSAVQGFGGMAEVKLPGAPAALKSIPLDKHLAQSWWEGGELKILIYRESEGDAPFASVKLVINTQVTEDEDGYAGTYELTVANLDPGVNKTETATGKVTCGAE